MLTSNEVCVYPPTNSCSTFPKGNNLGVSIRDISGYSVFNGNITIGTCREVDSQQLAIASCAPFQVTLNDMESTLHNIPQGLLCYNCKKISIAQSMLHVSS